MKNKKPIDWPIFFSGLFMILTVFFLDYANTAYGQTELLNEVTSSGDRSTLGYCFGTVEDFRCSNIIEYHNWQKEQQISKIEKTPTAEKVKVVKLNKMMAFITQYSRADSCHNVVNGKCLMASGKAVYEGAVACPYSLKLGTKVSINGKTYTCEDRYSKWLDAKRGLPTFDIFVEANPKGLFKTEVTIL
jgi:hypothetical protein